MIPNQDARLLPTDKKRLFRIYAKHYLLNASEFKWGEEMYSEYVHTGIGHGTNQSSRISIVAYKQYYFKFGRLSAEFSPGRSQMVEHAEVTGLDASRWFNAFDTWLSALERELNVPDLWAMAAQDGDFMRLTWADASNAPFTPQERDRIAESLQQIKSQLLKVEESQQFQQEQLDHIDRQFNEMKDASGRMGRKDWTAAFIGYFFGVCSNLTVDPAKANALFQFAGSALQWIWGVSGKLIGA